MAPLPDKFSGIDDLKAFQVVTTMYVRSRGKTLSRDELGYRPSIPNLSAHYTFITRSLLLSVSLSNCLVVDLHRRINPLFIRSKPTAWHIMVITSQPTLSLSLSPRSSLHHSALLTSSTATCQQTRMPPSKYRDYRDYRSYRTGPEVSKVCM